MSRLKLKIEEKVGRDVDVVTYDGLNPRIKKAVLEDAHLEGADLWRAHLERADLEGVHLEGADLKEAKFSPRPG